MNVLGINSVFHESSAALLVDGKVVAACEEERFNRVKHGKPAQIDNPQELPEQAIRFCLNHAGLKMSDIDRVAYSFDPQLRRKEYHADWWPDSQMEDTFLGCLGEVGDAVDRLFGRKLGEAACSTLAHGEGMRIKPVETFSYPHSLGFVWERASDYLGFSPYDASKVMGLAAYGDPEVYRRQMASVIQVSEDSYQVDLAALGFPSFDLKGFELLLGPKREPDEEIVIQHMHFAAALQDATNAAVLAMLRRLERSVGLKRLCVAGGVALN